MIQSPADEASNPKRTSRTLGGMVNRDLNKSRKAFTPEYQEWLDRQVEKRQEQG